MQMNSANLTKNFESYLDILTTVHRHLTDAERQALTGFASYLVERGEVTSHNLTQYIGVYLAGAFFTLEQVQAVWEFESWLIIILLLEERAFMKHVRKPCDAPACQDAGVRMSLDETYAENEG